MKERLDRYRQAPVLAAAVFVATVTGCVPKPTPAYVDDQKTATVGHPSNTGTIAANKIPAYPPYTYSGQSRKGESWWSLTKLTDTEVCLDYGTELQGTAEATEAAAAKLFDTSKQSNVALYARDAHETSAPLLLTLTQPPSITHTGQGTYMTRTEVADGRRIECVDPVYRSQGPGKPNKYVGCREYGSVDATTFEKTRHEGEIVTVEFGTRFCGPNNGIVSSTDPYLDFKHVAWRYRFTLANGVARNGSWGGVGGNPTVGSERDVVSQPQAPDQPTDSSATLEPKRPAPPRGQPTADLAVHAKVRLRDRQVLYHGRGGVFAEVKRSGDLTLRGRTVANISERGLVTVRGTPSLAVDEKWNVWALQKGQVVKIMTAKSNSLVDSASGNRFELSKEGFVTLHAKGRTKRSREKLVTRGEPRLALLIAAMTSEQMSWR